MENKVKEVKEKLICGLTESQIATLKRQHGFLVIVTIQQGGVELKEKINHLETLLLDQGDKLQAQKPKLYEELQNAKEEYESKHMFHAIFKEPTFEVLEATGAIGKNSEIKGTVALYDNCIIKADDEISGRDFAKLKALEGLAKHMNSFSVDVKNL
ncbi:hypothetical protein N4T20_02510 [Flavobacterium sp. TR2]|uniref:hypothetical protein n=1 Tax=Flavobacterium sp. TR2 TaxID=2977321 RepID=UPI0021B102CF|nr:hypothetical protein [Flavobacterium sp. TR2]UWY28803.1 hypothetical protein N4T20_02510 [Flavobacterium sp. TR2]